MPKLSRNNKKQLDILYRKLEERTEAYTGYPANASFDYSDLFRFLKFPLNNIGDPFRDSNFGVSTSEFEREVLNFFADLYHIPRTNYWGYITNGGTESNMYGLYLAREAHPNGIVYFSEDVHYSIPKTVKVLNMMSITVKSQDNGEIDYTDFENKVIKNKNKPVIVLANIGTTMRGAIDSIKTITGILKHLKTKKYYIHCDAALSGMFLPFIKNAPIFDFRLPVDSISVSGHKFIGMPIPSGVVIAKKKNVERVKTLVEYIGTSDTTLSGSRNGLTPLMFWYAIKNLGLKGFREMAMDCAKKSNYVSKLLSDIGWDAWKNDFSMTIIIKKPPQEICDKWRIAVQKNIAHLVIMPHTKRKNLELLVKDLS